MFAIVEFGSAVRGSSDKHSDRDLLIVSESSLHRALRQSYENEGYSVSTLTSSQLSAMQQRGSLFIQHLKYESRVLHDYQGFFNKWLARCQLIQPTSDEILRCIESIEFLYSWPADPRLNGWKADVAYCLFRDFLIKKLATKSKLVFGLDNIENALQETALFPELNMDYLKQLREAKAAYRIGSKILNITSGSLNYELKSLLEGIGLVIDKCSYISIEAYIMSLKNRRFTSAYEQLRSLEAAYLIARSDGAYHPEHRKLMSLIEAPNAYGSSQVRNQNKVGEYLEQVLTLKANKAMHTTSV